MAGTSLSLTVGAAMGEYALLRLAVADLFTLEWAPYRPDRAHVSISLLSPCCIHPLVPNLGPGSDPTACSECGARYPYSLTSFHLGSTQGKWSFDGNAFSVLLADHCEPLTAAVIESEVEDLMGELMNRASGEYAWQPEGNLRGASILPLTKQFQLCHGLLTRFGGEVDHGVFS